MPKRIVTLKRQALSTALGRDHVMDRWYGDDTRANCHCVQCNALVQVIVRPAPNEIDIGGTAVALNCSRIKEVSDNTLRDIVLTGEKSHKHYWEALSELMLRLPHISMAEWMAERKRIMGS